MSAIDDAFLRLKSNLEITAAEREIAAKRHKLIRDHVRARWDLADDFLTGSYRRHTKTKRLKDVDIFVVIDPEGAQSYLADRPADEAVGLLQDVLSSRWTTESDDNVVRIFYADESVASYEVAPVFADGDDYLIPNGGEWMRTNPKAHARLVSEKNAACEDRFVPLVKMIKRINRHAGEPVQPSFLLEVMALELVDAPMMSYRDELSVFLASAAQQIELEWSDPAYVGDPINANVPLAERAELKRTIHGWQHVAEHAALLEQEGREGAAVEKWRELFGELMSK